MSTQPTRRDLLSAVVVASLAGATLPAAAATNRPAWESELAERLALASRARATVRNRLHSGRDSLQRWEGRHPFPHGQGAAACYEWAQRYCAAFEAAGMSQRRADHVATIAVCEAICREAVTRAGNTLADRRALARLLPYDAGGMIRDALTERALG